MESWSTAVRKPSVFLWEARKRSAQAQIGYILILDLKNKIISNSSNLFLGLICKLIYTHIPSQVMCL